jgi:hypothetical protein
MTLVDDLACFKTTDATISRITTDDNTSTGTQTESESTIGTFKCIFWVGRQAESVVAEKLRGRVSAVAVFDYDQNVKLHDNVLVNGTTYNALDPDNIGFQNEGLLVPLEAKK